VARESSQSLYRPDLASFDMTGYDAKHAEGFIKLFGLPLVAVAQRGQNAGEPIASEPTGGDQEPIEVTRGR
jgi:argininosuccinate synthase